MTNATSGGVASACLPGFHFERADGNWTTLLVDGAARGYTGWSHGSNTANFTLTEAVDRNLSLHVDHVDAGPVDVAEGPDAISDASANASANASSDASSDEISAPSVPRTSVPWKLLARASIVELYVADVFLVVDSTLWRTGGRAAMTGRLARTACSTADRMRIKSVRQMTLPPWSPAPNEAQHGPMMP